MKSIRNVFFLGLIISLIVTSFTFGQDCLDGYIEQENVLKKSIQDIGADFEKMDIHCKGKFSNEFLSEDEVVLLGREVAKKLGVSKVNSDKIVKKSGFMQYIINDESLIPMNITISSYINDNKNRMETNIFVNLIKNKKSSQIHDIMRNVEDMFIQYGIKPKITTCVIGSFQGKLNKSNMNEKILMTIENVNGKIVDDCKDENLVSVTAYIPFLKKYIYSGNKKMNYNIAMRYNEYENRTYVWIGTPIIAISY